MPILCPVPQTQNATTSKSQQLPPPPVQQFPPRSSFVVIPPRPPVRTAPYPPAPPRVILSPVHRQQVFIPRPGAPLQQPLPRPNANPQLRFRNPAPSTRVYRFFNQLFSEDGTPIKFGPDGRTMIRLPPDSIPLEQRQTVIAQINRYKQAQEAKANANKANTPSLNGSATPATPTATSTSHSRPSVNSTPTQNH